MLWHQPGGLKSANHSVDKHTFEAVTSHVADSSSLFSCSTSQEPNVSYNPPPEPWYLDPKHIPHTPPHQKWGIWVNFWNELSFMQCLPCVKLHMVTPQDCFIPSPPQHHLFFSLWHALTHTLRNVMSCTVKCEPVGPAGRVMMWCTWLGK